MPASRMNITDSMFYTVHIPVTIVAGLASFVMAFLAVCLVIRNPSLRQDGKRLFLVIILVCQLLQHLISAVALFLTFFTGEISPMLCSVYHLLHHWVVFMEYNCLSAMCVDCYLAICFPFRYQTMCHLQSVLLALAVLTTISLGVPLIVFLSWASSAASSKLVGGSLQLCEGYSLDSDLLLMKTLWIVLSAIWLSLSTIVIVFCYVMVYREGKKAGLITLSNKRAISTILFQVVHLSMFFAPFLLMLVFLQLPHKQIMKLSTYEAIESINFVAWTIAQLLCPVVYGLRSKEIRDAVSKLMGNLKLRMGWSSKTRPV
ncbi:hypothetical protein NDU88_008412 [Pleurodeles waltl]|uniref:G-protein coupled receptors family 1 profile domain-containing protein n=1 Tax=Pleurodeles waltl TaxID=8319 RepID=A0AAV7PP34_PLEWA|nr:hypothetical protein NDU88_008412 [Pleurodeles waltl]